MSNSTNSKEETIMNNSTNSKEATTMNNSTENSKEATTMNATQNNNAEATGLMASNTEAQTETVEKDMMPTVVTGNKDVMAHLIDEDERAIDDAGAYKIQNALRMIDLSPIRGMGNIQNILGGRLYAMVYEDYKGVRYIDFCQRYDNGGFSPKMRIPQDDLLTMAMLEMNSQLIDEESIADMKKKVAKFKVRVHKEYFGKFRGSVTEVIPVDNILKGLAMVLHSLPEYSDDARSQDRIEFYRQTAELAKMCPSQVVCDFNSYYALTEEEIIYLAMEMKMNKFSFLRKLKDYNLLYLTDSSTGYQVNVRCRYHNGDTDTEWRYCIVKLSHLVGEEDTASGGIDLDTL